MAANAPIAMKETLTVSDHSSSSLPYFIIPLPTFESWDIFFRVILGFFFCFCWSHHSYCFFTVTGLRNSISLCFCDYPRKIVSMPLFDLHFLIFCSCRALELTRNSLHLIMWRWNRISTYVSGKHHLKTVLLSLIWTCPCNLWDAPSLLILLWWILIPEFSLLKVKDPWPWFVFWATMQAFYSNIHFWSYNRNIILWFISESQPIKQPHSI